MPKPIPEAVEEIGSGFNQRLLASSGGTLAVQQGPGVGPQGVGGVGPDHVDGFARPHELPFAYQQRERLEIIILIAGRGVQCLARPMAYDAGGGLLADVVAAADTRLFGLLRSWHA